MKKHVVAERSEPTGHRGTGAFIHEETHLQALRCQRHEGRVAQGFCGKQETRLNVLDRQTFVFSEDFRRRGTVGQQIEDIVHGKTRSL